MNPEQVQQFVQSQVQSTFEFIRIDIKNLVVNHMVVQDPSISQLEWIVTRKTNQIIRGMVQFSELDQEAINNPGFLRLQIMGAVAIGLHPMSYSITEFLNSYRSEYIQEEGRNSITELMLRSILNSMIADGITKPNALNKLVEILHIKQNVSEKYAALQHRKKH